MWHVLPKRKGSVMNKKEIVRLFLSRMEEQVSQYQTTLAETRRQVIDAPSANQSHSDTSKSQLSGLALGQESRLREIELVVRTLKGLDILPRERVVAGSVFAVRGNEQEVRNYFMFPGAQSVEIEIDGKAVIAISAKSPLGTAALGKRKGEKIRYSQIDAEIVDIW